MKAVVMAGGFGHRLRPFTLTCPKPMLPLSNQPVLAHILNLLKRHHFSEVIIATHYLSEQIQDYFGNGSQQGMTLHYSVEEMPLGTAGSVKNAQIYLDDEPFLVISGDIVTDINLSQVVQFHQEKDALATLALTHVADPTYYGVVVTDHAGHIRQYIEKPSRQRAISQSVISQRALLHTVNTGIYVLDPELLDNMKPNTAYDFSCDIFPRMLKQPETLFGCLAEGYWRDMGTIQSYEQCIEDAHAGKVNILQDEVSEWIAASESAKLADASIAESLAVMYAALEPLREQKSEVRDILQQKASSVLLTQ